MSTNTDTSTHNPAKKTCLTRGFLVSTLGAIILYFGSWLGFQFFWGDFTTAGVIMGITICFIWLGIGFGIRYTRTTDKNPRVWDRNEKVLKCLFWVLMLFPAYFFLYGFCGLCNNRDFKKLAIQDSENISKIYEQYDTWRTTEIGKAGVNFRSYIISVQKDGMVDSSTDTTTKIYKYVSTRVSPLVLDTVKVKDWEEESIDATKIDSERDCWNNFATKIDDNWGMAKYRVIADSLIQKQGIKLFIDSVMQVFQSDKALIPVVNENKGVFDVADDYAKFDALNSMPHESEYANNFLSIPSVLRYNIWITIGGVVICFGVAFMIFVFALPIRTRKISPKKRKK